MDAQAIIIQLIISGSGIVGSIIAVVVILARRLGNSNGNTNGAAGVQKQLDVGVEGTKSLSEQFFTQVGTCNQLWRENSENMGNIKAKLEIIINKLDGKI